VEQSPKSEDMEKTDGCQLATNIEETSQEICGVEPASIVPVTVPEIVPITSKVSSVPCSEARATATLRRYRSSHSTVPQIAVTDPLKIVSPFMNEICEDTNYQCSTCEKTFRKKLLLDCHMKYHHGNTGAPSGRVSRGCVRQRSSISMAASAAGSTPARRTHCRINSTRM